LNRSKSNTDLIYNDRIKAKRVRLVHEEKMIGEMLLNEALNRARSQGLDLVVVAEGEIPICKILDVSHYRYEKKKSDREAARKQREMTVETKEIQLRPVTDDNDLNIKAKKTRGFLDEGDKVKIVVRFRGRERQHKDLGQNTLAKFLNLVGEHKVEKPLGQEDDMCTIISPLLTKAEIRKAKTCQE
jgi:translation initiation factor IF-3